MTTGPPDHAASPSDFTCLLRGLLDDFLLYSGQEQSEWLIDIAHDICDPAQKRGSLKVWDMAEQMWRNVNGTDPPIASTYCYDVQTMISLSKISNRSGKSKTTATSHPSTMARRVKQRDDQQCWVTRVREPLINSHVCPKRMGDHVFRVIYRNFVSTPPPTLSLYDDICGISLVTLLGSWFDTYELGLRLVAPNEYICHSFLPPGYPRDWQRTTAGTVSAIPTSMVGDPIHGHRAGPPLPHHPRNPPPGLLRWHYLQCVINKFAHSDYKAMQNIYHSKLPLRMEGDSDDEGTDSEFEWPSAGLDHGRVIQAEIEHREERHNRVTDWITAL
ncbi:hypothetical protein APHAL10511_001530 [Amanita phalloides]|nr:hypothetical protein APHAL10511_001530 [Amanita phalloides]